MKLSSDLTNFMESKENASHLKNFSMLRLLYFLEEERKKRLADEERKRAKERLEQDRQKLLEEQKRSQAEKDKHEADRQKKQALVSGNAYSNSMLVGWLLLYI